MSTVVSSKVHRHRHTQSAATSPAAASSQNPQNPHHLNLQSHAQISQSEMSDSYQSNPTTPPRTPRRADQPSENRAKTENGSKQRPRNKNRPKNVTTSPAATRKGRSSPPLTQAQSGGILSSAKPISTPSTTPYAGATFHASPAPSALPIPSFYSKSVPDSPGVKGLKLREASLSDSPTPPVPASNTSSRQISQVQQEESPLDFFFRADREEKARAKSAQNVVTATGPFNPPLQSPRLSQTPPATGSQNHPSHSSKVSPSAIFAMELDGDSTVGSPIGPAFSTPYAERINAARPRQQPTQDAQAALTSSEALKAYLFSGPQQAPPSAPSGNPFTGKFASAQVQTSSAANQNFTGPLHHSRSAGFPQRPHQNNSSFSHDSKPLSHGPRTSGRSSGLRQEVSPTRTPTKALDWNTGYSTSPTPSQAYGNSNSSDTNDLIGNMRNSAVQTSSRGVSSGQMSADIKGMEDSLRKMLKLDSAGSSGVAGGIGNVPAATVSVPNYVGGRPPPMNGMQNGVMGS